MPRRVSVPLPTLGRTVIYHGYASESDSAVPLVGTIIAAPANPAWDDTVTLLVTAPDGIQHTFRNKRCAPIPDVPQLGYFTWPPFKGNVDVNVDDSRGYGEEPSGTQARAVHLPPTAPEAAEPDGAPEDDAPGLPVGDQVEPVAPVVDQPPSTSELPPAPPREPIGSPDAHAPAAQG